MSLMTTASPGEGEHTINDAIHVRNREEATESEFSAVAAACDLGADKDAITARNQRDSPLLRLPAELRNRIWSYVLQQDSILNMGSGNLIEVKIPGVITQRRVQKIIRMTATCRQIRFETHLLFFGLQVFLFGPGVFKIWLRKFTAEQRASIRHVLVPEYETRRGYSREFWENVGKLHSLEKLVVVTRPAKMNRIDKIERLCLKKVNSVLDHKVELVIEQW